MPVQQENHEARLEHIPGLHAAAGLQAVRGRVPSYIRLLVKFAQTHREDATRIRAAVEAEDMETARREAHSAKGVAATLGLFAIQETAAQLEAAIKEALAIDQTAATLTPKLQPLYERLESDLSKTCTAIQEQLSDTLPAA